MGILDNVFESVGKTINDASQTVVSKSKELSDVSKLNSMISDEQKKVDGLYSLIGKKYFEVHPDSQEEGFAEMVSSIKTSLAQLENYKDELQRLRGVRMCPHCGAELSSSALFCSSCGNKLEPIVNPNQMVCTNCGAQLTPGSKFCGNCSYPVGGQPQINVAENVEFAKAAEQASETVDQNVETIQEVVDEAVDKTTETVQEEVVENQGENE